MASPKQQAWSLDQLTKSMFFHQKLHQWDVIEIADAINAIKGETVKWSLYDLRISQAAWNKVIHRGIKPIIVFAHPHILTTIVRSTSYYRMLSMVSQKSMNQVGLSVTRYEVGGAFPTQDAASAIAQHLNSIISKLIEDDEEIDAREFDLWRGMAAGSQAQGSWQNSKGDRAEIVVKAMLQRQFSDKGLVKEQETVADEDKDERFLKIQLADGQLAVFGDEPDVAFFFNGETTKAIEIKGGIDRAGVLERIGAAIKSLSRAKEENPDAVTILIVQGVSVTKQARNDLKTNKRVVNYWFTVEQLLDDEQARNKFFDLLGIG